MELEVTWGRTAKVWWAFFWRNIVAIIAATVAGVILISIVGFILGALGVSLQTLQLVAAPIGIVIGLAITIVPLKLILGKDFGEFRLVLLQNVNGV
jgi:hypothetical protein